MKKDGVLVEDFQMPKTFRIRFELFLNSNQTNPDKWRNILMISDSFGGLKYIPLALYLKPKEEQNKPGHFVIKSEVKLRGRPTIIIFNEFTVKHDHWPS